MGLRRTIRKIFHKKKKEETYLKNIYKTDFGKKALVSYITAPYRQNNSFKHQNYSTAHVISETFSELGYDVDVIEYCEQDREIDYGTYSVIFGFGYNLENSFYHPDRSIPRIHFITGAHEVLQNKMSLQSVKDFYNLSGLWLPNESNVRKDRTYYADFNSDMVIIFAHGFVLEDYASRFEHKVHSLNNNILGLFRNFKIKTAEERKPNFLFLSGARLISKGLFLMLEVARLRKDLNFFVVVYQIDDALRNYYDDLFKEGSNVFLYQNISMNSLEMKEIVENCNYCVSPSYTDGLPGGVIEPMSAGLIPIVSKYGGFPKKEFIFEMKELTRDGLMESIDSVLELDDMAYLEKSNAVRTYAAEEFSVANVKKQLKDILSSELSGT